jgi:sulfur relay (sulfurtransferase) complex TusBCD TusD component (DsrE family)
MKPLKTQVAVWLLAIVPVSVQAAEPAPAADEQGKKRYLVEMSCAPDDRDAVAATLRMALALREDRSEVTLFIDADAVHVANESSDAQTEDLRRESAELFAKLQTAGVSVIVCPHCAELHGLPAKALRQGLRFTTKEELEARRNRADKIYEYRPVAPTKADDGKLADEPRTT